MESPLAGDTDGLQTNARNPVPEASGTEEGRGQVSSGSRTVVTLRSRAEMINRQFSPYPLAGLLTSIAWAEKDKEQPYEWH
ncbi:MAG: hypothetical protein RLZZ117_1793 [Cyanobacteriota bacterium]